MELTFALVVIALAVGFAIVRWRRIGFKDAPSWFAICSVIFVNIAFLIDYLDTLRRPAAFPHEGLTVVSLGLMSFLVGAAVSGTIIRNRRPVAADGSTPEVVSNRRLILVSLLVLVPAWLYFALLGYVPLFEGTQAVLSDGLDGLGALQASRLSRDSYASVNGVRIPGQGIMQIMRNLGSPIVAAYAVAQIHTFGKSNLRVGVLLASAITVLLAGQRWPLMYLGIGIVAGASVVGVRFRVRQVAAVAASIVTVGVAASVLQMRTLDRVNSWGEAISFGVRNLRDRVFLDQSLVPILSYRSEVFPPGSLQGRSYLQSLRAYVPGPGASFPVEFYTTVTGDTHNYTAAPDFYTEGYINFGWSGVVFISVLWAFVLSWVSKTQLSRDPTLDAGAKGGLVAVLALSCFTGPVFTLAGFILAVALPFTAELLFPMRINTESANAYSVSERVREL